MPDPATSPMSAQDWMSRLRSWGVRPSRSKGQNFLVDHSVVRRIVDAANIRPGEVVVEIGPGLGILTTELLDRGATVHAIEMDDTLAPRLRQHFRAHGAFTLHHDNAATVDPADLVGAGGYKVVANLPYSVATLIVRNYLEAPYSPSQLTVMVQKEVAERMSADTGGMSLLTLAVRIFSQPVLLFDVPEDAFIPAPKVTSSVVQLDVRDAPLLDSEGQARLFEIATMAFQQRRKTLVNSLARGLDQEKPVVANELARLDIDIAARPQAVSLEDWLTLASSPVFQR